MSKDQGLKRIPIPFGQRLKEVRLRLIPLIVFTAALGTIGYLWKDYVAMPTMVGQAEPVLSHVSSYKAGVLAELNVTRFQKVRAGDVVGQVMVTDPKVMASSLAVIQSEIEMLRIGMKPIGQQQRYSMDFDRMQLDWMKNRADLASARVNLQLAESEFNRMESLYKDQIIAQRVFEQAKANRERLQSQVNELSALVTQAEINLKNVQLTNAPDISKISTDPLMAAIEVQKAKLKLTEDELSPLVLKAAMDGIVTIITRRSGEAITAGQPIVSIATLNPVRIVAYLRPPIMSEPVVGMRVEVRTRGGRRQVGLAKIMEIGTQMESLPTTLSNPAKAGFLEQGLPVDISMPGNLNIRAGELVDVIVLANQN